MKDEDAGREDQHLQVSRGNAFPYTKPIRVLSEQKSYLFLKKQQRREESWDHNFLR